MIIVIFNILSSSSLSNFTNLFIASLFSTRFFKEFVEGKVLCAKILDRSVKCFLLEACHSGHGFALFVCLFGTHSFIIIYHNFHMTFIAVFVVFFSGSSGFLIVDLYDTTGEDIHINQYLIDTNIALPSCYPVGIPASKHSSTDIQLLQPRMLPGWCCILMLTRINVIIHPS